MIAIQEIITTWTKQSRPAPRAAKRNATPEAMLLRFLPGLDPQKEGLYHAVRFGEADAFATPAHKVEALTLKPRLLVGCVRLYPEAASVRVRFVYEARCGGAPARSALPREVFRIAPGEHKRIVYNGRFVWSGSNGMWYYRKHVVNVGWLEREDPEAFLRGTPETFCELAHLR